MKRLLNTNTVIPDSETHLIDLYNKGKASKMSVLNYQRDRLDTALEYVKDYGIAIDIGANIGLLTRQIALYFNEVIAYEPSPKIFSCLKTNTSQFSNIALVNVAVGHQETTCQLKEATDNSGETAVAAIDSGEVPLKTIDELNLSGCGFMKLDIQGFEYFALKGAAMTIHKYHPVILLEEEDESKLVRNVPGLYGLKSIQAARNYLLYEHGYVVKKKIRHDLVLV